MSTELAVREYLVNEIESMAKQVGRSGLFGMNEAQAFTLMLLANAKGIHPIQAVERYHVVQGRPAMKADAMLADFQQRGGTVKWVTMTDQEFVQGAGGYLRRETMVPKHLEGLMSLSPSTNLKTLVIEHAYWLAWQRGKMPPLEDVLADIDRLKDVAWEERAEAEQAAFEAITRD